MNWLGGLSERPNETVLKTVMRRSRIEGSNPSPSADIPGLSRRPGIFVSAAHKRSTEQIWNPFLPLLLVNFETDVQPVNQGDLALKAASSPRLPMMAERLFSAQHNKKPSVC